MHPALLLLKKIPRGKVTTYKALARATRTSPRAIGMIMKTNPRPDICHCYKVVAADGSLGGYSGKGGLRGKVRLLRRDGIAVIDGKIDEKYFYKFT